MNDHSVILMGGPSSGKTNYLARLWESLRSHDGALRAADVPGDIEYVEESLAHLLQGEFAPRSDRNYDASNQGFAVNVVPASDPTSSPIQLVVPDVTGELWKDAVRTSELPLRWMSALRNSSGAMLFVCDGSDQNFDPLNWVTSAKILQMPIQSDVDHNDSMQVPTQVSLCELLRFMEYALGKDSGCVRPRVAIMVTAWDRIDAVRSALGPRAYLEAEFPLLAGRLNDIQSLEVRVFGVSVVGGDFVDENFKRKFFETELKTSGYVVLDSENVTVMETDLTLPVSWVISGQMSNT